MKALQWETLVDGEERAECAFWSTLPSGNPILPSAKPVLVGVEFVATPTTLLVKTESHEFEDFVQEYPVSSVEQAQDLAQRLSALVYAVGAAPGENGGGQ